MKSFLRWVLLDLKIGAFDDVRKLVSLIQQASQMRYCHMDFWRIDEGISRLAAEIVYKVEVYENRIHVYRIPNQMRKLAAYSVDPKMRSEFIRELEPVCSSIFSTLQPRNMS